MADVKWIKITTDMFDNRKIKYLRKLPEGNSIVLIWVMLLTIAGKCNAGGMIFLTENIPYTTKMLADELEFEENTVKLALSALEQFGMIVFNEEMFAISGWSEHQNVDGLDKIREQNRKRVAAHREKQKMITSNATVTQCNVTSNVTVMQGNAADIDKEKDIRTRVFICGKHQNVNLTEDEFEKLKKQFPNDYQERIDRFSSGLATYGYKYKNHYLAILQWAENEKKESQPQYHPSAQVTENVNWDVLNEEIQRNAVAR